MTIFDLFNTPHRLKSVPKVAQAALRLHFQVRMKAIFRLASLLVLMSSTAFAESEWVGFKPSNDPVVPGPIRETAKSVFRIFYPGPPFETVDLSDTSKIESIIKKYASKNWELTQLAYCRAQEILQCPVSPDEKMGGGSAFVVRDSSTLATNLHNLQPWLSAVRLANNWSDEETKAKISDLVVPFVLSDQNQKPIFEPIEGLMKGAYRIRLMNRHAQLFSRDTHFRHINFALSDYVELQFVNAFKVTPLQVSDAVPSGPFFVVGYPGPTTVFSAMGAGDADGVRQMISVGDETAMPSSGFFAAVANTSRYLLRTTTPSYVGNSGGPVLNSQGQVVGILSAGDLYHQVEGKPAYFSEVLKLNLLSELTPNW